MEQKVTRDTGKQYDEIIERCAQLFTQKTSDYGTAWRVLRTISIADQIYIKALRIRTIQEKGKQMITDDVTSEFIGIINYAIIGNIQLHLDESAPEELQPDHAVSLYRAQAIAAKTLMNNKNHDYGEAWREMCEESMIDLILMKLQRIRQIIKNDGKTVVSEGLDANFFDIINYGVFAMILRKEQQLK